MNKNEAILGNGRVSLEGQLLDRKSLRAITGKTADWSEIAKDCIAFANATGGRLLLGIEDAQNDPPPDQHIPADLPDTVRRKLAERTVNVTTLPDIVTASNGGQYIELRIPRSEVDTSKRDKLLSALRASDQLKGSVKEKSDDELLEHYQLAQGQTLTNLGVLCLGRQYHRAQLATAPVIQFIKYDEHRPYTQRGDIFLNLHPDRLEVANPGPLPLGVTPQNVLHTTVRRNEHLARLLHDLKLMEREGY